MVLEVSYVEWTPEALLRNVVYLGEREDQAAPDVIRSARRSSTLRRWQAPRPS
jgi:hypothetical protein